MLRAAIKASVATTGLIDIRCYPSKCWATHAAALCKQSVSGPADNYAICRVVHSPTPTLDPDLADNLAFTSAALSRQAVATEELRIL
jgi:hypothetical protein